MFNCILLILPILFLTYSVSAVENCKNFENNPLYEQVLSEIKSCHPHDIHLTFDDGPSTIATEKILNELKKRNIKASFFISTTNLEKSSELRNLVMQEINEGHSVGDHGYDHNAYDLRVVNGKIEEKGYTPAEATKQINKSINLLNTATNGKFNLQKNKMFRFPYGRGAMPSPEELNLMEEQGKIVFESKNFSERLLQYRKSSPALGSISDFGFSHLGWNHDSQDFKYGIKSDSQINIKDFVKDNIKRMCGSKDSAQVALFHDIKIINAKSIPLIIDIGQCLGLRFVSAPTIINSSKRLRESGVFIPKDFQLKKAVKQVSDGLDILINKLAVSGCEVNNLKSCYSSSNGKTYRQCEGEDSICYEGHWVSREKAILERKCNLDNN